MLLATFWFALMNAFTKMLNHLPVMEIVFFRCGISTIMCFIALKHLNVSWAGSNRKLLFLRGIFGTMALVAFFITIKKMPLGSAVTIQYLSPIFTTIIAIFILKENVRLWQWFYFLISFAGVILIKGFDQRISLFYLGVGIFSAIFSSLAYNMVRSLKEKEHPAVVVLHFQLIGAITGLVFSIFQWQMPQKWDWLWLLLIGITTQFGQVNMTKAFQKEKIASVSILAYLGVIYAILFGYFIFDEKYTLISLFGIALVVLGVLLDLLFKPKNESEVIKL